MTCPRAFPFRAQRYSFFVRRWKSFSTQDCNPRNWVHFQSQPWNLPTWLSPTQCVFFPFFPFFFSFFLFLLSHSQPGAVGNHPQCCQWWVRWRRYLGKHLSQLCQQSGFQRGFLCFVHSSSLEFPDQCCVEKSQCYRVPYCSSISRTKQQLHQHSIVCPGGDWQWSDFARQRDRHHLFIAWVYHHHFSG